MSTRPDFAETFARDGCLSIERLFDPKLIDAANAEFERQFAAVDPSALPPHLRVGHRRLQLPIEVRGAIAEPLLTAHPLLVRMMTALLGPYPALDSLTCIVALPGAKAQHLHRDHPPLFDESGEVEEGLPAFAVTVAIPLIDLSPETGSTFLHPGSQRITGTDGKPDSELAPAQPAFLARGGCYLMDYRLWHQGMANRSQRLRPLLYIVYARHWFTDRSTNFQMHERMRVSRETLLAMPRNQRGLFRRLAAKGAHDLTEAELLEV